MKLRTKGSGAGVSVSWSHFFWCTVFFIVVSCLLFTGSTTFSSSSLRIPFFFGKHYQPLSVSTWKKTAMEAVSESEELVGSQMVSVREAVLFPDQAVLFLGYPPSVRLFTKGDLECIYFWGNSTEPQLRRPPVAVDSKNANEQIVRCLLQYPVIDLRVHLKLLSDGKVISGPTRHWDSLVYEALIDRDNTTVVFIKGLNLRQERLSNATKFECVYGWDFNSSEFLLRGEVISIAQEIVRCETPLRVLNGRAYGGNQSTAKVSVRVRDGGSTFHSIAKLSHRIAAASYSPIKAHEMCVCTMVRNQARFIREWIVYHAKVGVERWFIYDNNSDDDSETLIESLNDAGYNVSRHVWPWIKTQEAGFAHCAIRARSVCDWVGFIDVDEFFHMPTGLDLRDVLRNKSASGNVAELRVWCHSFGPSGLKHVPREGVTVGYTCRMAIPERHKSIVRPEALNSSMINVVHHFHLKAGFEFVNMERGIVVINHYKYQVWEVFKEKFYRRVATYVADWQDQQNFRSKDRAPGLGTRAVEPADWSSRFCEVHDTGLRDRVLQIFANPQTHILPWQKADNENRTGREASH